MTRRTTVIAILLALLLNGLIPIAAAAVDSAPSPASMAAVGDSITQAASSDGDLGVDAPRNSWSTGTNTTVNSHAQRLGLTAAAANLSVSGAKVTDLDAQMRNVVDLPTDPGYLTVLIGGNDLCTDTIEEMTPVSVFRDAFATAMTTVTSGSPDTYVYVVSIPDVHQLWELFRNNFFARAVWSAGNICQSLLANPTSNQQADVQRRTAFRQRNIDYNTALAEVCAAFAARCHFDGNAVFNTPLERSDVSGDYFHPSTAGQAKLAQVSWAAGYAFEDASPQPNQPPTAEFDVSCSGLTCAFDGSASTDADGTITAYSWDFGDGLAGSGATVSHSFASAATYTVTLTTGDEDGGSSSTSHSIDVGPMFASTVGTAQSTGKNTWTATVTITVLDSGGRAVENATASATWSVGASDSCVTDASGSCQVTSDAFQTRKVASVTLTISGVAHATLTYTSEGSDTTETVVRPT